MVMFSVGKKITTLRENPLLLAAMISLAIHLVLFGSWKLNQRFGWVKNISMPRWLQRATRNAPQKAAPPIESRIREVPLLFVDVDPLASVKQPPKETKFYGAANSEASSKKTAAVELPDVQGQQDKVIKTTDNSVAKPQPLQPAPVSDKVEETEQKAQTKAQQALGDLAFAKPQNQEKKSEESTELEKQAKSRPRKLEDVKPSLRGEKMKQPGGAKRLSLEPSFDVKLTSFGDYDREFIAAVQQCWYELLAGRTTVPGKIVVQFRLNYDGRVTQLQVAENTTRDLMLELICKSAIDKP
ncbi:MAG: hypothetical protein ABI042_00120, partial [Verrucomicrobiota bacterium]